MGIEEIKEKIKGYCKANEGTKTADVLKLLCRKKFVTNDDIITLKFNKTRHVFTTNPQKLIEVLRKELGYGLIIDEFATYKKIIFRKGKPVQTTERYKKYWLNLEFEGI